MLSVFITVPLLGMRFCSRTGGYVIYRNTIICAYIFLKWGTGKFTVSLSKLPNVNNMNLGLVKSSFPDSLKTEKSLKGKVLLFLT